MRIPRSPKIFVLAAIVVATGSFFLSERIFSASSLLGMSCSGEAEGSLWTYVCRKTVGDPDVSVRKDAAGSVVFLGDTTKTGDVQILGQSTSYPRSSLKRGSSGATELLDSTGRILFRDLKPVSVPRLAPEMPSVAILGDLDMSGDSGVTLDLRSPSPDITSGRAVFIGNAPHITIDVSGKKGQDGRGAGTAMSMQVASGEFGSGATAANLVSKMGLSSSPAEPKLSWSDISNVAARCEDLDGGFKTPEPSADGGKSIVVTVDKAREQTVIRNICERKTSQEVSVQSMCVRPGEVAATVTCDYPDISQKVGVYRRPPQEKTVSFSCAAGDLSGVWKTSCASTEASVVTAAIRPDYTVVSPSKDIVSGMAIPLRHNFPLALALALPCRTSNYYRLLETDAGDNYFSHGGFNPTDLSPVSSGAVNLYMASGEFSSYVTPAAPAFLGQSSSLLQSAIKDRAGNYATDDCGQTVTKLTKIGMLGGLIEKTEETILPGSKADMAQDIRKVTNLGYWAKRGSKASSPKPDRNVTDALSGYKIPAKASSHDAAFKDNNQASNPDWLSSIPGKMEGELSDLGLLPFSKSGAVISYDKLTATRQKTNGEGSFLEAVKPMILASGELVKDGEGAVITSPTDDEKIEAFLARIGSKTGQTSSPLLSIKFREKITYKIRGLRAGLATKKNGTGINDSVIYRAVTEPLAVAPKAIYIPGEFSAEPITTVKYCDSIDIDNSETFFQNGDSVTLGGLEIPNGYRMNMRSPVSHTSVLQSDEASATNRGETPGNFMSGWGMSFLKLNQIGVASKNAGCTASSQNVTVEHVMSSDQKNILNKIRNSSGLLIVSYGTTGESTIDVFFSPAMTAKPTAENPTPKFLINTGISDGLYLPRVNVSPAQIASSVDTSGDSGNQAFGELTGDTKIPSEDKVWLPYRMIKGSSSVAMKANFSLGLEYYDLPSSFFADGTRSLTTDDVNPSASDTLGSMGTPARAARYIKSLRKMSLAAAPGNPAASVTTVRRDNSGGTLKDSSGTAAAILADSLGIYKGGSSPVQYCTSESMVDTFVYPTKLLSRRAVGGESTGHDFDMNVTANEEVSDAVGPINKRSRSIGYFSRAFLPTTMTVGIDNKTKNRSDPYFVARDYNTYLADIQKNSSLVVETPPSSTLPRFRITNPQTSVNPFGRTDETLSVFKPYDLGLKFEFTDSRIRQISRLVPSTLPGSPDIKSGRTEIYDPSVWSCLSQKRDLSCLPRSGLGLFVPPFTLTTARIFHQNAVSCVIGDFLCTPLADVNILETPEVTLLSPENHVFRPHMMDGAGWYDFVRCSNGKDYTDTSACTPLSGRGVITRTGKKRPDQIPVEGMTDLSFNTTYKIKYFNKSFFTGLLAPKVAPESALFTASGASSTLLRGMTSSGVTASDVGLRERPSEEADLISMGYTSKRIRLVGGPLSSQDGGASYFEGTLGLPVIGGDTKLWLEWWETGALNVTTSDGAIAYYKTKDVFEQIGIIVGTGFLGGIATGGSDYPAYNISSNTDETPPAAFYRVAAGITPYGGPEPIASSSGCQTEGTRECFAASRGQKNVAAANPSGDTSTVELRRNGMSGYLFSRCSDNLDQASRVSPQGNGEGTDERHAFTMEASAGGINYTSEQNYTLYLPFALRDWDGAYYGPVVGGDFEPLYKDGYRRNALALKDHSASGRASSGVDVYRSGSQQKVVSELKFPDQGGTSATLYDASAVEGRRPYAVTLSAAIEDAKNVLSQPVVSGTKSYENPLAISPDVLIGILLHDNLGDQSQDGQPLGSTPKTAVYLMDSVRELASPYTVQKAETEGFTLNRLASSSGVASGMILAPQEKQDDTRASRVSFSWIVSNDSVLATVVSPGVASGTQSDATELSGGVVNGIAGGVAINFGTVIGDLTDTRDFTSASPSFSSQKISRSDGVQPALMSGAGFAITPMESISGVTAKFKTDLDGSSRVGLKSPMTIAGQRSSAFFLADEICGERKIASDETSSGSIQNAVQDFSYCVARNAAGNEIPLYNIRSESECLAQTGEWRHEAVPMTSSAVGSATRHNPYRTVCSYAATSGRQTASGIPSKWNEISTDVPSLEPGGCAAATTGLGMTVCEIDRENSMNNNYWDTQRVDVTYGYDAYGIPTGNLLAESEDPRVPTSCPSGTALKSQQFIATSNPPLATFTAMDNFAGAAFDANQKPQCPYSCSVSGIGINSLETCTDKTTRPAESQSLPNGTWSRMTQVASVNVELFKDNSLCYSTQTGASVRDMRTEDEKISGSIACGGTYGKCSKPGRFNKIMCESSSLPGGAGVWTDQAPADSSFKPTAMYGNLSPFMSTLESVGSSSLTPRTGSSSYEPYSILTAVTEVNRRSPASIGAKSVMRAGEGSSEPDGLGYIWLRESVFERPLCQDFTFSRTDGQSAPLITNSSDLGILMPRSSSVDERRRYGALDPFMVRTKARQVTIEGGAGTNIAAYADLCDLQSVEAADETPVARTGFDLAAPSSLSILDFTRRIGIDYIRGEAVSVTKIQATPWSSEWVDGNGFTPPSCDIFTDLTIATREGRVSVDKSDLPADGNFFIGEERSGVDRRTAFKANPDAMQDSSSRNETKAFAYGGNWHKIGEERLELTKANSTTAVECRFYTDSSFGQDHCTADVAVSTETVDGQSLNIIAENGENGGGAGSAVVLSTAKPKSLKILADGGAGGRAGGTEIEGSPAGPMMCYAAGKDPLAPQVRVYKFRQNSASVKPGSDGYAGPGGTGRGKAYWGVMPEARKYLQKAVAP